MLCFMLHFTFVITKSELTYFTWNHITTSGANNLERIQQKFVVLSYILILP